MNRYDLCVFYGDKEVYFGSFTSLNHLVKFSCGFDKVCLIEAFDTLVERQLPIYDLIKEFRSTVYGI